MNENGFYTEWTEHRLRVKPGFTGPILTISGKNKDDIKDYLHDVFYVALTETLDDI